MDNTITTQVDEKLITVFENLKKEVASFDDVQELRDLRNTALGFEQAWKAHWSASGEGLDMMTLGWEAKVRAERRMGELLGEMNLKEKRLDNLKQNPKSHDETSDLDDLGISKTQSYRYQLISRIDDKKFEEKINEIKASFKEPATKMLFDNAHVAYNSGENEWYTPPQYIEAARKTMGGIDLDPASSDKANEIVKANQYYTAEQNGLEKEWFGKVWLNPPYSQPLVDYFTAKLKDELVENHVQQACVLVNNATETKWLSRLLKICVGVCFIKGRIKFIDKNGKPGDAPLQGQVILYFGKNKMEFNNNFNQFGTILWNVGL